MLIGDDRAFGWDHVWITFTEVRLIGRGGQDVVVLDEETELDLLRLKHFTERLVADAASPTGSIKKVRFVISDIRLEKVDDLGAPIEVQHPRLPANGKIDVLLKRADVRAGEKLVIEFDFDLKRSFYKKLDNGGVVDFRPVITADTSTEGLAPRLMRVEGDVETVSGGTMKVCDIRSAARHHGWSHDYEICMQLETTDDTEYFSEMNDGFPVVVIPGDHIVAYGLLSMEAMEDTLIAEVVAVGEKFVRLSGEALTVVDGGAFDLTGDGHHETYSDDDEDSDSDADSGSHDSDGVRHVVLLADGAKVFDAEPKQVDASAIAVTNLLEAEGYPPTMEGDPDVHAFIVLLNHEVLVVAGAPTPTTVVAGEQVIGVVSSYGGTYVYLTTNEDVFDCVMVKDGQTTDIVQIFIDADGMTATRMLDSLDAPPGGVVQSIDAVGPPRGEGVCLVADSIVLEFLE